MNVFYDFLNIYIFLTHLTDIIGHFQEGQALGPGGASSGPPTLPKSFEISCSNVQCAERRLSDASDRQWANGPDEHFTESSVLFTAGPITSFCLSSHAIRIFPSTCTSRKEEIKRERDDLVSKLWCEQTWCENANPSVPL